jgi:hypothetical protein
MKKVLLLAAGVIAIFVFAVLYLFGDSQETVQPVFDQTVSDTSVATTSQSLSGVGSLTQLQGMTGNLECQITYDTASEEDVSGTLFLSDGNLRADFLMNNVEFGQYAASVIVLPDYTYSWSQIEGNAYGVRLQTVNVNSQPNGNESGLPLTTSDRVRYSCQEWASVDGSVFMPPATVLFKDAATIEAAGMEYGTIYEEELP